MIKTVCHTLSLSFAVLAAVAVSNAADRTSSSPAGPPVIDAERAPCGIQAEIDRGWEIQQELLEARLAGRATEEDLVKGAIIVPPFPEFAPYRSDIPMAKASRRTARNTKIVGR